MQIRLASGLQSDSIVDGEGIRTVIWTQGCPHNCFDCHNPETHDFKGGALIDIDYIKNEIDLLETQNGVTFSGGDPMCQPKECSIIAEYCHNKGLNVWCYTGYTFEQLIELSKTKKEILNFLNQIDVLIDGKFVMAQKSLDAIFRGSKNQRIIDVKKSLKNQKVVLIEKYIINNDNKKCNQRKQEIYI